MTACSVYLNFNGNCREAFDFYVKATGGELTAVSTFGEAPPGMPITEDFKSKIMHARIKLGDTWLMGSDSPPHMWSKPAGFGVSLQVDTPEDAARIFGNLAEGGAITMPMAPSFFAKAFGMLHDKFGVMWMVICEMPM
ncbi:MAG TPA: VOC family protein [Caulobacteraceae bacterium]|jgi:PhnB protein|nr:VOC family protein [Caulobacteraceae bacterium]